jgi:hypothetical protein
MDHNLTVRRPIAKRRKTGTHHRSRKAISDPAILEQVAPGARILLSFSFI